LLAVGGLACGLLLLAGCGMTESRGPQAAIAMTEAKEVRPQPMKICLLLNRNGRGNRAQVEQIRRDDLVPLLEFLGQSGGELAFGAISSDSSGPLIRLSITPPPVVPPQPKKNGNPFEDAIIHAKFQKELKNFNVKHRQWEEETKRKVNDFMVRVEPFLSRNAETRSWSDIGGAVRRADIFLAEDDAVWKQPTKRFVVLISDGRDNVVAP